VITTKSGGSRSGGGCGLRLDGGGVGSGVRPMLPFGCLSAQDDIDEIFAL
jgi:hypothetical protein